jgi:uncharacterized repeat protein (TIGR01451 family)
MTTPSNHWQSVETAKRFQALGRSRGQKRLRAPTAWAVVLATSCLAAAFGLIAVLGPAPALAEFGSPQTVSSDEDSSGSPQVAVDPQGNAVAVWVSFGTQVQAAFRPAGGSFGPPQTISAGSSFPLSLLQALQVAVDSEGNAVAVWTRSSTVSLCREICLGTRTETTVEAAFRPRDGSFGPVQPIATGAYFDDSGGQNDDGRRLFSARVALGPEGDAIAVWERLDVVSDPSGVRHVEQHVDAAFRPAGALFGPGQAISTSAASQPDIAVGSQGTAVAVWRSDGANNRIEAAFSSGAGVFGTPQTISDAGSHDPQVAVNPDGDAVALWVREVGDDRSIEAGFRPQDGSFGTPQTISDPGQSFDPRVAMDAQGGAAAVWQRSGDGIQAAFRPAGGGFGDVQTVSDPGGNSARVAVDPGGGAVAVWQRSTYDIEAAFRPAGGGFGEVQTVSDPGAQDAGSPSPQVAVDSEGGAVAVWRRSGDSQSLAAIEAAFHPAPADIALTNSGSPDRVLVGEQLTYALDVTNNGPSNASGVTLTDLLPRSVRLRSARSDHGRCTQRRPGRVDCNLAELSSGETATVTIVVRPTRRGTIVNTATVRASQPIDSNPANNTATASTTVE